MNEEDFVKNYLQPSDSRLDRTFTHPLPPIEELRKCGDFIVQGELEETFSTNIITKYVSKSLGIKLVEVYKNTQNKKTGTLVRLVVTLSLVKTGYPILLLDAGITNLSPITTEREEITTRVVLHLPLAEAEERKIFFDGVSEKAQDDGISYREWEPDSLPVFWGPIWLGESEGVDLDMIRQLRDYAWVSYKQFAEQIKEKSPFDYKPVQEYMIFEASRSEHLMFKKMGLSVSAEAQAAFFSVMVSAGT